MHNATLAPKILCTFLVLAALPTQPLAEMPSPSPAAPTAPDAPAMLAEIADWLSQNFDLPTSATMPHVEIASPDRFATVRYRRLVEGQNSAAVAGLGNQPPADQFAEVVAFYENASQTIFLRQGWTGETPQEVSVLVHEMVHHLQNMAGTTYGCPAAREKLAYAAQQKWLAQAGQDFFEAFETDPMTLLVRTSCGF
jgi:hypothetical protein